MRLLIIDKEFPPKPHGGIGSYNFTLARTLGNQGHFVAALSGSGGQELSITEEEYGVLVRVPYQVKKMGIGKYFRWREAISFGRAVLPAAIKLVSQYGIELVEIPSSSGYGSVLANALRSKIPVVTRFHGVLGKIPIDPAASSLLTTELARMSTYQARRVAAAFLNSPQWWAERKQLVDSDRITFPSHFAKSWLQRHIDFVERNIQVIPNGIDPQEFTPSINSWASSTGNRKLICFVGRCSIAKGASVLARALPGILEQDQSADVLFAGPLVDQQIATRLSELSQQFPGRVQIPGSLPRAELLARLAGANMLVHPTFYETSSMAVLEAMALGLPVAASRTGPLPEIVAEAETGLLFQPGNDRELAEAVLELLSANPKRLASMSQAARERIERVFNFRTICQQIIQFYTDTISKVFVNS